ncbi:uncharacterized protein LOC122867165 isoform X2 [Siniperca chuatsi]|uniref:uncharacterized protein LOC122867165 isoform X2 n=2 Tax=Siniperca chuatsi TaxID=119488 RepID=UPI001CE18751|nr:uncharacterized protein LOC122867165 isoform X2 [Siniperca chuatsi]
MDTDFILKQVLHMRPSSFSVREQQRYRAEKMLMRQFMLMKLQYQIPIYLSAKDMENWLLAARSFLEEFQEIAKRAEARKLLVAELVTLEGLQMFLPVIHPKAEQDVQTFLCHLSNKLLKSFAGSNTSKRSQLALLAKLQRTTAPLVPQVVETALKFFLDEPEPLVGVRTSQTQDADASRVSSLACAQTNRVEAASAQIGKQLADAAATCFCLNTSFTKACLLRICTSVARDMVKAIYKRFVDRSKTFHLMDFDESFITARESVICAIQDMDDRVLSAAISGARHRLFTEKDPKTPDLCCVVAAERTNEKKDQEQGVRAFFSRMWKKMIH